MTSPDVALPTSDAHDRQDEGPVDDLDTFGERRRVRPLQIVALLAVVLFAVVIGRILTAPIDHQVNGDEASYVYSALSLRDFDLSYDAVDQARWLELGWRDQPIGLFTQTFDGGWAMAKPIGASVMLAPSLYLFGLYGIQVTGALLLTAYAGCWYFSSRLRWSREASAIVAVTAAVASHAWFYSFVAHADLFFAVLIGVLCYGCLRAALRTDPRWFWLAAVPAGLLVTEKTPALLAVSPIIAATFFLLRRRPALIGLGIIVAAGALSALPYLYYSDGASWSPYGGERYYVKTAAPWSGGGPDTIRSVATDEKLSPGFAIDRLGSTSTDVVDASLTYVVGRHTGALTFLPLAPIIAVAGAAVLMGGVWRRSSFERRSSESPSDYELDELDVAAAEPIDGSDEALPDVTPMPAEREWLPPRERAPSEATQVAATMGELDETVTDSPAGPDVGHPGQTAPLLAWAGLLSLILYAAFYIVLFTNNYYGGAGSIGNRYFLQFSLVAIVVPVAAGLTERGAIWCSAFAATWALLVLSPLFPRGQVMYNEFWHTTPLQRYLPFDETQSHPIGYWTGPEDRIDPPFSYSGSEARSQTGEVVGDAIIAKEGRDHAAFIAFGPFLQMSDGDYVVTFTYSSSASPDEPVAVIDVTSKPDSITVVESVEVAGTSGEPTEVSLAFTVDTPLGWEFRVFWNGTGNLTLHSVEIVPAQS